MTENNEDPLSYRSPPLSLTSGTGDDDYK